MLEMLAGWTVTQIVGYGSASIGALILGWILKRIPNEKISQVVEKFFYGLGVVCTLGASKKLKIWNKTVEPFVVDLVENTFLAALRGFIRGLRSDNSTKD